MEFKITTSTMVLRLWKFEHRFSSTTVICARSFKTPSTGNLVCSDVSTNSGDSDSTRRRSPKLLAGTRGNENKIYFMNISISINNTERCCYAMKKESLATESVTPPRNPEAQNKHLSCKLSIYFSRTRIYGLIATTSLFISIEKHLRQRLHSFIVYAPVTCYQQFNPQYMREEWLKRSEYIRCFWAKKDHNWGFAARKITPIMVNATTQPSQANC